MYSPLLVRQDVTPDLLLLALDSLDVREHPISLETLSELSWKVRVFISGN